MKDLQMPAKQIQYLLAFPDLKSRTECQQLQNWRQEELHKYMLAHKTHSLNIPDLKNVLCPFNYS